MPDLPLCFGVLKHRAPLAGGGGSSCQEKITMDFCFCGAILNLKAFCFRAIPDTMIELIVYVSVPQSRQSYLVRGPSKGPHNLSSTGQHFF